MNTALPVAPLQTLEAAANLIRWDGVNDIFKKMDKKEHQSTIYHYHLVTWRSWAHPETWQHLQTTMVSPWFWWKKNWLVFCWPNEKPSKKGWGLTGLPDIHWCEICFLQLSTEMVWEEIPNYPDYRVDVDIHTPYVFTKKPTIVWSMNWPTYPVVTWSKVRCPWWNAARSCQVAGFFQGPQVVEQERVTLRHCRMNPGEKCKKKCCNRLERLPKYTYSKSKNDSWSQHQTQLCKKRQNRKQSMRLLLHALNAGVQYASVAKGVVFYMYIEISDMSRAKPCVFEYIIIIYIQATQLKPCCSPYNWLDIFIRDQLLLCNCFGSPTWCCKEHEQQISTLAWVCMLNLLSYSLKEGTHW